MSAVEHAHDVREHLHGDTIFPGHPPRRATAAYEHSHHQLVYVLDKPCEICGVRHSTLSDPQQNPRGARVLETHHYPVQDSLANACDWRKVHLDFPQVVSQETFEAFVDSATNLKVLCDKCHVGYGGIHNTTAGYWVIQRYLIDGYQLWDESGKPADLARYISLDDHLTAAYEAAQHHEQQQQGQE